MGEPVVVCTLELKASPREGLTHPHQTTVMRALNTYYTGKPDIPIEDPVSQECEDAHYRFRRMQPCRVTVEFLSDGTSRYVGIR